jgi:hypothetical protein
VPGSEVLLQTSRSLRRRITVKAPPEFTSSPTWQRWIPGPAFGGWGGGPVRERLARRTA